MSRVPARDSTEPTTPLRVPVRRGFSSASRIVCTAASLTAVLAPLVVYLLTLAREVTVTDSGELIAVAATLGIAHPSGYPLFTLLGWALAHLVPVGTVAFRVGLLSAIAAALTALLIYRTGLVVVAPPETGSSPHAEPTTSPDPGPVAAVGGALFFAFARTPWSQAVVAEVYTLQALLTMLFLLACARALRPGANASRTWPAAGLAAGLCFVSLYPLTLHWHANDRHDFRLIACAVARHPRTSRARHGIVHRPLGHPDRSGHVLPACDRAAAGCVGARLWPAGQPLGGREAREGGARARPGPARRSWRRSERPGCWPSVARITTPPKAAHSSIGSGVRCSRRRYGLDEEAAAFNRRAAELVESTR